MQLQLSTASTLKSTPLQWKVQLEPLYQRTFPSSFRSLDVLSFRNGSVINNMDLRFKGTFPNNTQIANVLINAASDVTGFDIETSSITVDGIDVHSHSNDHNNCTNNDHRGSNEDHSLSNNFHGLSNKSRTKDHHRHSNDNHIYSSSNRNCSNNNHKDVHSHSNDHNICTNDDHSLSNNNSRSNDHDSYTNNDHRGSNEDPSLSSDVTGFDI
ncbi:hypothetical protein PAMA_013915 [Pampus argenteus]